MATHKTMSHCLWAANVNAGVDVVAGPLPRNPNGKIDRNRLATEWVQRQEVQA